MVWLDPYRTGSQCADKMAYLKDIARPMECKQHRLGLCNCSSVTSSSLWNHIVKRRQSPACDSVSALWRRRCRRYDSYQDVLCATCQVSEAIEHYWLHCPRQTELHSIHIIILLLWPFAPVNRRIKANYLSCDQRQHKQYVNFDGIGDNAIKCKRHMTEY